MDDLACPPQDTLARSPNHYRGGIACLEDLSASFLSARSIYLAAAAPASAHVQTPLDPDDSPGPLDIVAVRHRHRVFAVAETHPERFFKFTELKFRLVTYEKWERELVSGATISSRSSSTSTPILGLSVAS